MWCPSTFEESLLDTYIRKHPGQLFLEVPVGLKGGRLAARRIDGVLAQANTTEVFPPSSYSKTELKDAIEGESVHVVEAKRQLHRGLIGQIEVGTALLEREFDPKNVIPVALYAEGQPDMEWYCKQKGIRLAQYEINSPVTNTGESAENKSKLFQDIRKPPDDNRRRAFLSGWAQAVKGNLFTTNWKKKTHSNMGNLFGWIYGEQSDEFRETIWQRYIRHAPNKCWDSQDF